jgi:hypothetical protein
MLEPENQQAQVMGIDSSPSAKLVPSEILIR